MTKSEAKTRSEIVDKQLAQSGWNVKDPTQVINSFDIAVPHAPNEGYQFSDYVLLDKVGKPIAVVEAKQSSKDVAIGREQAKQYCENIQKQLGCELPFCFFTNGLEIYFWDLGNYPPRKVVVFPTRDDLERFQYMRSNGKPLTQELINTSITGRDY
jgi:type I restriction enzyme, R subunit